MAGEASVPTPAPTSAAPAVAAPVSTPAPAAPAAPVVPQEGERTEAFFKRSMEAKTPTNPDIPKPTPEVVPEVPAAEPTLDAEKPEGEKPVDAPPEGDKPADAPVDEIPAEDALSLEPEEVITPRDLAAKIKENPEVLAALEAAGIDKNTMFATARIAAKGAKVLEVVGDVDSAIAMKEQSEQFGGLSEMFSNQRTPEDTQNLLGEMMKLSYVLDDDGNPVVDEATGLPKNDGTVGVFMDNIFQMGLKFWEGQAEKSDNPDLKAAIEVLKEVYEQQSGSAPARDYSNLDAETKARLEAVDAREKEMATRQATERASKEKEFETKVGTGIESKVTSEVEGLLKNAALTDGQRKWAIDQIKERTIEKLKGSKVFYNKLDALMRRPASDKTLQARIGHGVNSARPLLVGVTRQVLEELGVQYGTQKAAASEKVAAQQQASRSEIKSATSRATPTALPTPTELNKIVIEEFKAANGGREPKGHELMAAVLMKQRTLSR